MSTIAPEAPAGPADASPVAPSAPPAEPPATRQEGASGDARPPARAPLATIAAVPASALVIAAVLALGLVFHITLLSQLQHDRAQTTAYADFRVELAQGTAPVGQLTEEGELLAPGTEVAVLEIPALGMREVVFEGTTSDVLRSGPGHRRDTVLPGQAGTSVIMGRQASYGGPFGFLHTLDPGEPLTVITGQGEHTYVVTGVRRSGDPVPHPAAEDEGRLTMVTATGPAFMPTDVLRVDAELVSEIQPAPQRAMTSAGLTEAERAMAGESEAWYPLVLLCEALLLASGLAVVAVRRWGTWQAWIVSIPMLTFVGLTTADHVARLLPNLM